MVLLLHATGFHARCWDKTVDELPDNCQVIALDLRGHGRSTKQGPFSWYDFGKDVVAFTEALNLQNIVVAGHSMGGHCALYAAALLPNRFRALILVDPVVLSSEQYDAHIDGMAQMNVGDHPIAHRRRYWDSPQEMFERFKDRHPFQLWREDILRDYCDYGLLPATDGFELACQPKIEASIYMGTSHRNIEHLFPNITQPTIVMRAKARIGPRQEMDFANSPTWPELANALPNAVDIYLPELSHFIPMQRPDLVAVEIRKQLKH